VTRYNGGYGYSDALALAVDSSGNVYVTGHSAAAIATVKYDTNGNQLWEARYNGNDHSYGHKVAVDARGNVYVTGMAAGEGAVTLKYNWDGTQLSATKYNSSTVTYDLVLDGSGSVYVTGTEATSAGRDFFTAKYANTTTPTGSNVTVQPLNTYTGGYPVSVTFVNVTSGGETTVDSRSGTGAPPPGGFTTFGTPPVYYHIETSVTYEGPITVCLSYKGVAYDNDNNIRLFHEASGVWEDITAPGYPDTVNKVVCGVTNSLSPFAIFTPLPSYGFAGFFQPVDNPPAVNTAKAGQAISLKWQLQKNGALVNSLSAVSSVQAQWVTCGSGTSSVENPVDADYSGASGLRYDVTTNQYIFVWKTDKRWVGRCYQLKVTLDDGKLYWADFLLK
jgi:hypothetical protein